MARSTPVHSGYSIRNGSCTGPNGYRINTWIEYKVQEQDIANNRSRVIAYFYYCLGDGYSSSTWGGSGCYSSFSVGGTSGTNLKSNDGYDFRTMTPDLLGQFNGWITHNADGTKTITLAGSFSTPSSYITGGSVSASVTLPTIPRATTPGVSNMTMGTQTTIDLSSRASSGFTHTLKYKVGSATGTIATKTSSTSINWTPSTSLATQYPSSTSGSVEITCETYNGETLIGTKKVTRTISVPASIVPSISSVTVTKESDNAAVSGWGVLVKGYSRLGVAVSAAGAGGSTIASYYFVVKRGTTTVFSATQSGASWLSGILSTPGEDYSVYVKVTDSRGRTDEYTTSAYTVYDYSLPRIIDVEVFRCLSDGTRDDTAGTYISAKATFGFSSVNGLNSITNKIEYRVKGAGSWAMGKDNPVTDNMAYVFGAGGISLINTYEVRFTVDDTVTGPITLTVEIRTALVELHFRIGGGMGIGGAADADELQVYKDAVFKEQLQANNDAVVGGTIFADGGIVLPNGVPVRHLLSTGMLCVTVSRNQYDAVFLGQYDNAEQQHAFLCVGTGGIAYVREPGASRKIWHEGNLPVEYGTWTPTLRGSTTAGTYTYSTRAGFYYRIGRYIYVTCRIQLSGVTTAGAGDMQVTGLPFTAMNVSGAFWSGPAVLAGVTGWTFSYVSAFLDTGTNVMRFYGTYNQAGSGFLAVTTAGSGDVINFSMGYLID